MFLFLCGVGFRICLCEQGHQSNQLCRNLAQELLGELWRDLPYSELAGRREADPL